MVEHFAAAPDHLYVQPTAGTQRVILHRLEAEVDELWSFVGTKANRQWVWIAMDADTRQIIAFHVGDRSRQSAEALWGKIPAGYQEQATFYTDRYEVYKGIVLNPTLRDHYAGPQNPSPRSLHLHRAATGLPSGVHHSIVLQEAQCSHRCDRILCLPFDHVRAASIPR